MHCRYSTPPKAMRLCRWLCVSPFPPTCIFFRIKSPRRHRVSASLHHFLTRKGGGNLRDESFQLRQLVGTCESYAKIRDPSFLVALEHIGDRGRRPQSHESAVVHAAAVVLLQE